MGDKFPQKIDSSMFLPGFFASVSPFGRRIGVLPSKMQVALHPSMIQLGFQLDASELDDIDLLVSKYWSRVLRFVTFSVHDVDLAQTITQDCFLKAYNARETFRGESTVSSWLIGIANNLIRDQVRLKKFQFWRKAEKTSLDVQELASFLPSSAKTPESSLLLSERTEQVRVALEELSVNQRRVLLLRFFEDMQINEIAEVTGMSPNTVKTHLLRGVGAIRARLGAENA